MLGVGIGLGVGEFIGRRPGIAPKLDLNFASTKSLTAYRGPTPSFSRASTGTYFNSSGVLTTAAINGARFDHTYNGTSWVSRGLLVEEQRTNVIQHSNDLNNAAWNSIRNVTITSNAAISPEGVSNANQLMETTASGTHGAIQISAKTSATYTLSVFVKPNGRDRVYLDLNIGSTDYIGYFDLTSKTYLGNGGFSSVDSYSIGDVGNGWLRLSITKNSALDNYGIFLVNGTSVSYAGDSSKGVYVYGFQLESGAFPTSYIPTTSASVTRSADVCQITGADFSGFWNGTEGSIAAEYDVYSPSVGSAQGESFLWQVDDGTNNNRIVVAGTSGSGASNKNRYAIIIGASPQVFIDNQVIPANVSVYSSAAWKLNDAAFYSGSNGLFDTSTAIPTGQSNLRIGQRTGDYYLNGHIARLRYFNKRLPNATLQQLSDPDPTLNLQFALNKTLTPVAGPAPSFSRASTGTYFNASGVLTSASINTPRFDHVYSGGQWVSRGLLLEEQQTNLQLSSENVDNTAYWSKTAVSVSANSGVAPDGNSTADFVIPTSGTGTKYLYSNPSPYAKTSGVNNAISLFAKSNDFQYITIQALDNGSGAYIHAGFDILNGTVGNTTTGGGAVFVNAFITNVGNGWFRCTVVGSSTGTQGYIAIGVGGNGTLTSTGDGVKGAYIWGIQAENNVSFPTSYIGTTSSSVTRSADVCQITGTSFNWMWNQEEGSFAVECDRISFPSTTSFAFEAYSDTSNKILLENDSSADYSSVRNGGVDVVSWVISPAIQPNVSNKSALAYKANDFAWSRLGATPVTDTSGGVPYCNALAIGNRGAYGALYALNGHIAKLIYYPARLTNAKLQQLST